MEDKDLGLIGLAYRGRRLEAGEQPVYRAIQDGRARLVVLASDAADNTSSRAAHKAEAAGVPTKHCVFTKQQLGEALGRSSCAIAAVCDAGFARELLRRL